MRILIADDHDLVRETLAAYLMSEAGANVRTASTLHAALAAVEAGGAFDLVLLDWNMPGMNGLDGLKTMIGANGGKPVAILSGSAAREVAESALDAGAAGFVPKSLASRSVVAAVRYMVAGEIYAPFRFLPPAGTTGAGLSRRETDILRALANGRSMAEIATIMDMQEVAVKLQVKTLGRKLGAADRDQTVAIGRARNLI